MMETSSKQPKQDANKRLLHLIDRRQLVTGIVLAITLAVGGVLFVAIKGLRDDAQSVADYELPAWSLVVFVALTIVSTWWATKSRRSRRTPSVWVYEMPYAGVIWPLSPYAKA